MSYRIGKGYDAHQLKEKLPFILGGVNIDYDKGVVAHSDGDVLIHAIIDSILGALALGNIGEFFPNTQEWENASGLLMLKKVKDFIFSKYKLTIINIDSTIILEEPKVSLYIDEMKHNISATLEIDITQISIKATTTDKLGFIGLGKGLAAESICLIKHDIE